MHTRITSLATALPVALFLALHRALDAGREDKGLEDNDGGQSTAEYALVLLGVAAIALAVVSWASKTNLVSRLLDVVFSALFRKIT